MRTNGTKYEPIDQLPAEALPVSAYARKHRTKFSSAAYVHVKYDRFKFGYTNTKGEFKRGEETDYEIVCFAGTNYVINRRN